MGWIDDVKVLRDFNLHGDREIEARRENDTNNGEVCLSTCLIYEDLLLSLTSSSGWSRA